MDYKDTHDELFYVEDEQPTRPTLTLSAKDTARLIARRRQDAIAGELSRLAGEEYLEDIMQHMRHMEDETLPDVNLIDMQREIQWFMRPYLIDFIIEAHSAFGLLPETLFLTINLLDRYCSKRVVYKQHYQLVGCAALLIAAKYGDKKDKVPQINELNNMCCGLYDAGMFTQMEMHVLNTLEWNIGHPTVDFFAQLIVADEADDHEVEHMAGFISEIALYHREFVSTKPSTMARASLALARAILGRPEVNDGEWDIHENQTLITLSQHLHMPTVTLSRKHSTPQTSRVAGKLADFLAAQSAINRRNVAMASPPCEAPMSNKVTDVYTTPQKGMGHMPGVADGYMTPPITPDGAVFGINGPPKDQYHQLPPRCPVTPTPQPSHTGYAPQAVSHHQQYAYFDARISGH